MIATGIDGLVEALGWTLLHFLWQGMVVAGALMVVLTVLRNATARARYLSSVLAFLTLPLCFAVTLAIHIGQIEWSVATVPEQPTAVSPAPPPFPVAEKMAPRSEKRTPVDDLPIGEFTPVTPYAPVGPALADSPDQRIPDRIIVTDAISSCIPRIVALWIAGSVLFSLRLLSGWRQVRRVCGHATPVSDATWQRNFSLLIERLQVHRPVRLLTSPTVAVPIVVGWMKPVVLVPTRLFTGLTPLQLEAVLAHELAHIRRYDYLVNLLQNLAETIFFFNPAVWWVSAQVRNEREYCCDDIASLDSGGPIHYARALTALEELRGHAVAPIAAVSANGGSLIRRVRRLLGEPSVSACHGIWPTLTVVVALAGVLVAGAHLANAKPDQADTTKEREAEEEVALAGVEVVEPKPEDAGFDFEIGEVKPHAMAPNLLERWQTLEGRETISESRMNIAREAINLWVKGNAEEAEACAALERLVKWHADRKEHSAEDVLKFLNAMSTIKHRTLTLAWSRTPHLSRPITETEKRAYDFGEADHRGLRVAWRMTPAKGSYVIGDLIYCQLIYWNTGDETIELGNAPTGNLAAQIIAVGKDGRSIKVEEPEGVKEHLDHFPAWILKPGEIAEASGYRLKIGVGESPLSLSGLPEPTPTHRLTGLQSGESIRLKVKTKTDSRFPWAEESTLTSGEVTFFTYSPEKAPAMSTNLAGTWQFPEHKVQLEVHTELVHGPNTMTTAVLKWPDGNQAGIHVAADFFGNRQRWAIAWEPAKPELRIASGDAGRHDPAKKEEATTLTHIDFSDPLRVIKSTYSGWPGEGEGKRPAVECQKALEDFMTISKDGELRFRSATWATPNSLRILNSSARINVYLKKDSDLIRIGDQGQFDSEEFPEGLLSHLIYQAKQMKTWDGFDDAQVFVEVSAEPSVSLEKIHKLIDRCRSLSLHKLVANPE